MQARLKPKDLENASFGRLFFTSRQAATIRAEATIRNNLQDPEAIARK